MAQGLEAWTEWNRKCALGLCGAETQEALRSFASPRFQGFLRKYRARIGGDRDDPVTAPQDAWHLFETHLVVGTGRDGKRYKDWLFARAGEPAGDAFRLIEAGATLLLRDVVREHLRREWAPRNAVSLDLPVSADGSSLSLQDFLPGGVDPSAEAERRELEEIARRKAEAFFSAAERRERVAVLAKRAGLSLAHPDVERAAGCRKSTLNDAYHACIRRIGEGIKAEYAAEPVDVVRVLILAVFDEFERLARRWVSSEKSCAQFSIGVEGNPVTP